VPFLASASSDLDDGHVEGETYDGDGESLIGQGPPSPRKELAGVDQTRSLVGYTPSQSLDYAAGPFNPPIRTSTPVYAYNEGYGRSTPPLPPYSVSEISGSLDEADSRLVESLRTPRPAQAAWSEKKRDREDAVVREMERRADGFYDTGLMGRCWDVWHKAESWIKVCSSRGSENGKMMPPRKQKSRSTQYGIVSCYPKPLRNGTLCTRMSSIYPTPPRNIETITSKLRRYKFG